MKGPSVATLVVAAIFSAGCGASAKSGPPVTSAASASSGLPQATTFASLKGVGLMTSAAQGEEGMVVHPTGAAVVYSGPNGSPVAVLPATELGAPTWVPVVETSAGWYRVLLPSRPNHASGWLRAQGLRTAHTPYSITVRLARQTLTLAEGDRTVGAWSVAVGGPKTPTPTGLTFVMAQLAPADPDPSPLILPLGAHSPTLDTFGGGPGTVALHGWPDSSVFGKAVTHGCVRVPPAALKKLAQVPLGTPVLITQ
jgi:lipoprotein-anchoring transpeptidase ErfK/SrfK